MPVYHNQLHQLLNNLTLYIIIVTDMKRDHLHANDVYVESGYFMTPTWGHMCPEIPDIRSLIHKFP